MQNTWQLYKTTGKQILLITETQKHFGFKQADIFVCITQGQIIIPVSKTYHSLSMEKTEASPTY